MQALLYDRKIPFQALLSKYVGQNTALSFFLENDFFLSDKKTMPYRCLDLCLKPSENLGLDITLVLCQSTTSHLTVCQIL